jgi:hypothetical protein
MSVLLHGHSSSGVWGRVMLILGSHIYAATSCRPGPSGPDLKTAERCVARGDRGRKRKPSLRPHSPVCRLAACSCNDYVHVHAPMARDHGRVVLSVR